MRKIILFLVLMLIGTNVYASGDTFYYDSEKVSEMWITKEKGDNKRSAHPYKLKRRGDNTYIYCLEPFVLLKKDATTYIEDADFTKYNLTQAQLDRINLIIYYGYGYRNHTSNIWYGVTQYLVWQEVDKEADIYFTSEKDGPRKKLYTKEINEIEALISEHKKEANFKDTYLLSTNQTLDIDSNITLDDYDITADIPYEKEGNTLKISNPQVGEYTFNLVKKNNRFKTEFQMFYSKNSQNVIVPGNSPIYSKEYSFKIIVKEGELELTKKSTTTNKYLKGAVYGVYQDGTLITKIKTDKKGKGSTKLPFGTYIIKELVAPAGYKLDNKEYQVIIGEDKLKIELNLYDEEDIYEVPDTGTNSIFYTHLGLIILGSLGLLYVKKKYYMY